MSVQLNPTCFSLSQLPLRFEISDVSEYIKKLKEAKSPSFEVIYQDLKSSYPNEIDLLEAVRNEECFYDGLFENDTSIIGFKKSNLELYFVANGNSLSSIYLEFLPGDFECRDLFSRLELKISDYHLQQGRHKIVDCEEALRFLAYLQKNCDLPFNILDYFKSHLENALSFRNIKRHEKRAIDVCLSPLENRIRQIQRSLSSAPLIDSFSLRRELQTLTTQVSESRKLIESEFDRQINPSPKGTSDKRYIFQRVLHTELAMTFVAQASELYNVIIEKFTIEPEKLTLYFDPEQGEALEELFSLTDYSTGVCEIIDPVMIRRIWFAIQFNKDLFLGQDKNFNISPKFASAINSLLAPLPFSDEDPPISLPPEPSAPEIISQITAPGGPDIIE